MKKLLAAVVLGLFMAAAAVKCSAETYSVRRAYRETCEIARYRCTGVPVPLARMSLFVDLSGNDGLYMGGRTVWLSPTLTDPKELYVVLVHEMVHYLQAYVDEKGPPFDSKLAKCLYEEEAFDVSNVVAERLDLPQREFKEWAMAYGCVAEPDKEEK